MLAGRQTFSRAHSHGKVRKAALCLSGAPERP